MRGKNNVTLAEALDMMVVELKMKGKLDESRIRDAWAELMGKPITKYTSSITFKDGKLYIKIDSPALKQELNYSRDKIKELFNKELGEQVIKDVVIF